MKHKIAAAVPSNKRFDLDWGVFSYEEIFPGTGISEGHPRNNISTRFPNISDRSKHPIDSSVATLLMCTPSFVFPRTHTKAYLQRQGDVEEACKGVTVQLVGRRNQRQGARAFRRKC